MAGLTAANELFLNEPVVLEEEVAKVETIKAAGCLHHVGGNWWLDLTDFDAMGRDVGKHEAAHLTSDVGSAYPTRVAYKVCQNEYNL